MKSCGEVVTDSMKVEKVLTGLTPNFDHIVSAIEQSKDLETLKLEQLLDSLQAHELKMKNKEGIKKEEKDFEKALFVKNQKKGGGDSWKNKKGKGKWKYNKQENSGSKSENQKKEGENNGKGKKKSKEHIQCYNCQKYGHHADECSNPKVPRKKGEEAQLAHDSDDEEVVLLMVIVDSETGNEE